MSTHERASSSTRSTIGRGASQLGDAWATSPSDDSVVIAPCYEGL
jgi:hypothetical protein